MRVSWRSRPSSSPGRHPSPLHESDRASVPHPASADRRSGRGDGTRRDRARADRVQDAAHGDIHRPARSSSPIPSSTESGSIDEFASRRPASSCIPHGDYGFFARETHHRDRDGARRSLGLGLTARDSALLRLHPRVQGRGRAAGRVAGGCQGAAEARLVVSGDPVRLDRRGAGELQAARPRGRDPSIRLPALCRRARYFAAADVLVLPYRHVSQSGVLFLALSLGFRWLPPASARCPKW